MQNIVLVHDHQCAPFVASGSVFSPSMVDYLMFQTYYSCHTLGIIAHMASGQIQLLPVPAQLIGQTFLDLLLVLATGVETEELHAVPIALMRPAGHLHAELRYIYTMPSPETPLVKGDLMYILRNSVIGATLWSPRTPQPGSQATSPKATANQNSDSDNVSAVAVGQASGSDSENAAEAPASEVVGNKPGIVRKPPPSPTPKQLS